MKWKLGLYRGYISCTDGYIFIKRERGVHIYIFIYIYIYIHIYIYVYVCLSIYLYTYINVHEGFEVLGLGTNPEGTRYQIAGDGKENGNYC